MIDTSYNFDGNFSLQPVQDDDYEALAALRNLLYPQHPSSVKSMQHGDKTRDKKILHQQWAWKKDSSILCSALYTQWEEIYHPQKFVIKIYVHPKQQGKGFGTICYDFLIDKLKPLDPLKITTQIYEPHQQSIHFFEKRGFKHTVTEKESSLDLTAYNPAEHKDKIVRINKHGFRIITYSDFRKEDKNADYKVWEFEREVSPDMPWPDPIEIPEYDIYSKQVLHHPKFNSDAWFLALYEDRIAGLNNLWKSEIPKGINNGLTGVRREYRRKGIATALKYNSLTWAKNQGYDWIRTDNADTNESMLSINIRAGFKFMPGWLIYEKMLKEEK